MAGNTDGKLHLTRKKMKMKMEMEIEAQ